MVKKKAIKKKKIRAEYGVVEEHLREPFEALISAHADYFIKVCETYETRIEIAAVMHQVHTIMMRIEANILDGKEPMEGMCDEEVRAS